MKYLLSLLILIGLFACKDKEETLAEKIIGTWKLETIAINACPNASNNLAAVMADADGCATLNSTTICQSVEFKTDGTVTNNSSLDGVTEIQNRSYTVNEISNEVISCDDNGECGTVLVLDNRMSLSSPFGDCIIISTYVK